MKKRYLIAGAGLILCSSAFILSSVNTKETTQTEVSENKKTNININFNNKSVEDMREYYTSEGQEFIKKILPDSISSDFAFLNIGKQLDKELKDITFTTINNKEIKLKDLKGKKVVIDFALSTCGTCENELKFLSSYDFKKEGIEYIHVFPRDNTSSIKSLYAKTKSNLKEDLVVSQTGLNGFRLDDLSITNVPSKIFIDENGIVQYAVVEGTNDKESLKVHLERAYNSNVPRLLDYLKK